MPFSQTHVHAHAGLSQWMDSRPYIFRDVSQYQQMLTSSRGFSCPFAEVSGHKWAAWNHPDPKGHQYRAVLFALEEFRSRNIPCALLWVDYTSIPQSNVFLQQAAINSLSVYATYSSVFLTLVTDDSNDQEALHSYNQRGWCRLELLSFMACGWSERESYICDGSLGPVIPSHA